MKDVIDFIRKHDYLISIKQINGGVSVRIPSFKNRFIDSSEKNVDLILKWGKKSSLIIKNKDKEDEIISLPEYSIRLFVGALLIKECLNMGYNFGFVELLNKKGGCVGYGINEKLFDLMKEPKIEIFEKETKLFKIIKECFQGGFLDMYEKLAIDSDVLDGFLLVKNLIEGELE